MTMRITAIKWAIPALAVSCLWMGAVALAANGGADPHEVIKPNETVLVKASSLHLRKEPKRSAGAVITLSEFSPVGVLKREGEWFLVKTPGGKQGYVESKYLTGCPFVSISGSMANVRSGPDGADPIVFRVYKNYPLKVLSKKERRLEVEDYEGDKGWVYETLVANKPYVIVNLPQINVRDKPGLDAKGQPLGKRRFVAEKGVVFQVLEEKDGWLKIKHADGDVGWCSGNIVWGYFDQD